MTRANAIVLLISIPVIILMMVIFGMLHGTANLFTIGNLALCFSAVFVGIILHEWIHGITWMIFGHKPFSAIKFGFQWKTITPYAHLKEPVEVNAYRIGAFMPGLILGIIPYSLNLLVGDGSLFWFSLFHTSAAGGDWLVLWLIRHVKPGTLVEDHPTNPGCYVLES